MLRIKFWTGTLSAATTGDHLQPTSAMPVSSCCGMSAWLRNRPPWKPCLLAGQHRRRKEQPG